MIKAKVDSKALEKKLSTASKGTLNGIHREARMAARLFCGIMAKYTQPFGFADERPATSMTLVKGDIERTQRKWDSLGSMWRDMEAFDEGLAAAYWVAVKAGNMAKVRRLLLKFTDYTSAATVNKDAHESARTTKRKRVPGKHKPTHIVTGKSAMEKYIATKQKTIGAAKAGWAKAAKSIGGSVSAREKFSAWFNTGQHKKSSGVHSVATTPTGLLFKMTNQVPWASEAIGRGGISQASREYPSLWKATMEGETKRKAEAALKRQLKKQNG